MKEFPYPGLRPFKKEESNIFFGRDEQIDSLLDKLQETRFVAVFGPSGYGKSSLVRAGLLPALESGFLLEAEAHWIIAEMRPSNQPFVRTAEALSHSGIFATENRPLADSPEVIKHIQAVLERGPSGLKEVLDETSFPPDTNLLLLVDQFEELFRYYQQGEEELTTAFVELLLKSAQQKEKPIYVVITIRSDFLGNCTAFLGLPEAINEGQFLTPRLTREEFQKAIEKPALLFNGKVEPALVTRLLNDAGTHLDQLPLMQHVLMQMWTSAAASSNQGKIILTLENYEKMGGFKEALSHHADKALEGMSRDQRHWTKMLFCALSERGSGQRDTRHPMKFKDICAILGCTSEDLKLVIEPFRTLERSFITPPLPTLLEGETMLDISHESLIRQWQTLQGWVAEEAESADIYKRLVRDAQDWKKDGTGLREAPRLDEDLQWKKRQNPQEAWAERYGGHLGLVNQFLIESENAEKARQRQKQKHEFTRRLAFFVALASLIVTIFSAWVLWEQRKTEEARVVAEASKKETEEALVLAEKSKKETEGALALAEKLKEEAEADRALAEESKKETEKALALTEASRKETEKALALAESAKEETEKALALTEASRKETEEALALAEKSKKEAEAAREKLQIALKKEKEARTKAEEAENAAKAAKKQAEIAEKQAEEAEKSKKQAEAALTTTEESKKELETARDSLIAALKKEETARIQTEEAEKLAEAAKDRALNAKKLVEDALAQSEKSKKEAERARDALAEVLKKEEEARAQAEFSKLEAQAARDTALKANERTERALALAEKSKKETEEALALAEKSKKETEEALALAEKLREEAERVRDSLRVALKNEGEARTKAELAEKEVSAARDKAVKVKKQAEEALALAEKFQRDAEAARVDLQKALEKEKAAQIQVGLAEEAAKTAKTQAKIAKKQAQEAREAQEQAEAALTTTEKSKKELEAARDSLREALKKEESARIQAEEAEKLAESAKDQALSAKKQVEIALAQTEKLKKEAENARDALAAVLKKETEARAQAELAKREAQEARDLAIKANEKTEEALAFAEESNKATQRVLTLVRRSKEEADRAREEAKATEKQRTLDLFESQLTHASLLAEAEDYAGAKTILAKSRQLDESIPASRRHARNLLTWFTHLKGSGPEINFDGGGIPLQKIEISSDGHKLAAAGEQGAVIIYERDSGKLLKRLEGHTNDVRGLVFHPKGHTLYSGGLDQNIISWSFPEGKKLDEWETSIDIESLAISPDGRTLASGAFNGDIVLWNTQTGEQLKTLEGHKKSIAPHNGLAFSSDGKLLASASYDGTARIWELATGQSKLLDGQNQFVDGIAFHPNGRLVATALDDNTIRLWDLEANQVKVLNGHQNSVFGLQFTPSGDRLVSTSRDRTLRIWDTKSGVMLHVLQGHTAAISAVSLARGLIYSASSDGAIKGWLDKSTEFMQIVDLKQEPRSVAISTSGSKLTVGFANGDLWLYSLLHKEVFWKKVGAHNDGIIRIAFSPDSQLVATSSLDSTVKLWPIEGEQKLSQTLVGHSDIVHDVTFSPDGQTIATASYDGQIGLFQWKEDKSLFFEAYDGERVFSIDFDNTGTRLISTGNDQQIKIWNLAENPPTLLQAIIQPQDSVTWATISPDGQFIASAGQDQIVSLYSMEDKRKLFDLVGHENTVFRAIFSPDSQQLATASADATIRLWDLEAGRELFVLPLPIDLNSSFSPLWDFDFRCATLLNESVGKCWIAVPLTSGRLILYDLGTPY